MNERTHRPRSLHTVQVQHRNAEADAQLAEGRRLAALERGEVVETPRSASPEAPTEPLKPFKAEKQEKLPPSGHEALLEKLRVAQTNIRLRLVDSDELIAGKVMHWDKFSVSVKIEAYTCPEGYVKQHRVGETAVFFKAALAAFTPYAGESK